MRFKTLWLILCFSLCSIQIQGRTAKSLTKPKPAKNQLQRDLAPPDHVIYDFLYQRIALLESLADEKEREGKDSFGLRNKMRNDLMIADYQAELLREEAADCLEKVQELDQRAHEIISQTRALFPGGRSNGQRPLQFPKELTSLQAERNNLFLTSQVRLKKALGDYQFVALDDVIKRHFAEGIEKQRSKAGLHK